MIGTVGASLGVWARKVDANDANPALTVNQRGAGDILSLQAAGAVIGKVTTTGYAIPDTDKSHFLTLLWNENDSGNRTLNLLVAGGDRSLTVEATSLVNQDLTTDATPTFAKVTLGAAANRGTTNPTNALDLFNGTAPVGTLTNGCTLYSAGGNPALMDSGGHALTINATASATLTVEATSVVNQDLSSDATPTFAGLTANGNISLGANKLLTTNHSLRQLDSTFLAIRTADDSDYSNLIAAILCPLTAIQAYDADGYAFAIRARDTGVAQVNIARAVGAADPYFEIGRDDTGVALNAVTDMLVFQAGGGTGNEASGFGLGIAVNLGNAASQVEKRGYLNWVLTTATDGSEAVKLDIGLMKAGALAVAASISATGVFTPTSDIVLGIDMQVLLNPSAAAIDCILPAVDARGQIGNATKRFSLVRAVTITSGDFVFENGWRLTEAERLGLEEGIALVRPDNRVAHVWR